MSSQQDQITFRRKLNSKNGVKRKAQEFHGRCGWNEGNELHLFYTHVGWVSGKKKEEYATMKWALGTVFASRSSYVPAPSILGMRGWRWNGPQRGREKVVYKTSGWVGVNPRHHDQRDVAQETHGDIGCD